MPGQMNAKEAINGSSSGTATFDETYFSEQSRHDLRELFTMIARLHAENNALRATAHLESIIERPKEQAKKPELPQLERKSGNPFSRRLERLAAAAIDLPLDIKDDDLSINDLVLLCTVLEDDKQRAALLSFAGDSVTFPELSFCLRSLAVCGTFPLQLAFHEPASPNVSNDFRMEPVCQQTGLAFGICFQHINSSYLCNDPKHNHVLASLYRHRALSLSRSIRRSTQICRRNSLPQILKSRNTASIMARDVSFLEAIVMEKIVTIIPIFNMMMDIRKVFGLRLHLRLKILVVP
ncbi:hypothetical protein F52700_6322 [Fusarium sp. NRRL 52700]|nr:hypothetical protein F52700_6322 [Fusarium sp. NRRL 52700]